MAKVVLCSGIFYPDVGGPAIHVMKIAQRLVQEGMEPVVLAYGDDPQQKDFGFCVHRISRNQHKALQWLRYFWYAIRFARTADVVYAFDPTAAGVPARVAAKFTRKPFLIRIGGDPIWEREAQAGRRLMPITQYYVEGLYKKDKPRLFKIIRWILRSADRVVLYNEFWKTFFNRYFDLSFDSVRIVKNPAFRREQAHTELSKDPTIIFAGRFVAYKNLPRLMRAFDAVREKIGKGTLLLIGKGQEEPILKQLQRELAHGNHIIFHESVPQDELFAKIKEAAVAIGPALSEFNPNFILESLSFGKPVLLSRGHGLSVELPEEFLFDPMSQEELEQKIEWMFDPDNYRHAVQMVSNLDMSQSWEDVTDFHLAQIQELLKN